MGVYAGRMAASVSGDTPVSTPVTLMLGGASAAGAGLVLTIAQLDAWLPGLVDDVPAGGLAILAFVFAGWMVRSARQMLDDMRAIRTEERAHEARQLAEERERYETERAVWLAEREQLMATVGDLVRQLRGWVP